MSQPRKNIGQYIVPLAALIKYVQMAKEHEKYLSLLTAQQYSPLETRVQTTSLDDQISNYLTNQPTSPQTTDSTLNDKVSSLYNLVKQTNLLKQKKKKNNQPFYLEHLLYSTYQQIGSMLGNINTKELLKEAKKQNQVTDADKERSITEHPLVKLLDLSYALNQKYANLSIPKPPALIRQDEREMKKKPKYPESPRERYLGGLIELTYQFLNKLRKIPHMPKIGLPKKRVEARYQPGK